MRDVRLLAMSGSILLLASCGGGGGGGGGGGLNSTPSPTPSPTPTPTPTPLGTWSDRTTSRSFTAFMVRREHDTSGTTVTNLTAPSVGDTAQVQIRYSTSDQSYHVTLPGLAEGRISETADYFRPVLGTGGSIVARTDASSTPNATYPFVYARLASWTATTVAGLPSVRIGAFAYGTPTLGGDIPLVGTAHFDGHIDGFADTSFPLSDYGEPNRFYGSLDLDVNFGSGSFSGVINPTFADCQDFYCYYHLDMPDFGFTGTLASAGSNGLTGQFTTSVTGPNSFTGLFAGPAAAEAYGKFHLPYIDPRDLVNHIMFGVWVAKKAP